MSAFDTKVTLGVTGLSRSGKTVFITSLVKNLLDGKRLPMLNAMREGRIEAVYLQPQPKDTIPRFAYEANLATLTSKSPAWPEGTKMISQLRLSFRVRNSGLIGLASGFRTIHLDIVDYPGEWILDLPLMQQSFSEFSKLSLEKMKTERLNKAADAFLKLMPSADAKFDEVQAQALSDAFRDYLEACRKQGFVALAPGRFTMPGDLQGSPALSFAPLSEDATASEFGKEFKRRFAAYKSKVVKPFFRDHFAKIDRQIVLVDGLEALSAGPNALADLRATMADILSCFKPGRNTIFSCFI